MQDLAEIDLWRETHRAVRASQQCVRKLHAMLREDPAPEKLQQAPSSTSYSNDFIH